MGHLRCPEYVFSVLNSNRSCCCFPLLLFGKVSIHRFSVAFKNDLAASSLPRPSLTGVPSLTSSAVVIQSRTTKTERGLMGKVPINRLCWHCLWRCLFHCFFKLVPMSRLYALTDFIISSLSLKICYNIHPDYSHYSQPSLSKCCRSFARYRSETGY